MVLRIVIQIEKDSNNKGSLDSKTKVNKEELINRSLDRNSYRLFKVRTDRYLYSSIDKKSDRLLKEFIDRYLDRISDSLANRNSNSTIDANSDREQDSSNAVSSDSNRKGNLEKLLNKSKNNLIYIYIYNCIRLNIILYLIATLLYTTYSFRQFS